MHACPIGYAIRGVHLAGNKFLCERVVAAAKAGDLVSSRVVTLFAANDVARHCPIGSYMRGIQVENQEAICSSLKGREVENVSVQSSEGGRNNEQGMFACPNGPSDVRKGVLLGFSGDSNRFSCGYITAVE